MSAEKHKIVYALKDNELVSINDVERGLKCACVCPACGEPLIARKGDKMMHHFAHHSGSDCDYAYESSLHLMAKRILSETQCIMIPPVYIDFPSYKEKETLSEAKEIMVDNVELEKYYGNIVPDIIVYSKGRPLFIEIYVTHKIDDSKLKKLQEKGISVIEIDLSDIEKNISVDELKHILIDNCKEKQWKYNAVANNAYKKFLGSSEKYEAVKRGFASHIDNCPLNMRIWKGKTYANVIDDCLNCQYCVKYDAPFVYCSGKKRIAALSDFKIDEKIRIEENIKKEKAQKEQMIANGRCPFCGAELKMRDGKYGEFVGCASYPHCGFFAKINKDTGEVIFE